MSHFLKIFILFDVTKLMYNQFISCLLPFAILGLLWYISKNFSMEQITSVYAVNDEISSIVRLCSLRYYVFILGKIIKSKSEAHT